MTAQTHVQVAVIGGGPAGIAAAIAAAKEGASVLLIEREARLGGILKQCIHDGFGLLRFGQKLSGPEYAERYIALLRETGVQVLPLTFATRIVCTEGGFQLTLVGRQGVSTATASTLVLATGCRERTARQVAIHGTRPAGIYTAGTAQYYTNILGQLPGRRCVVLGSGDIGLIMARRLTLEGAKVLGVYEAKPTPSGLSRNIAQCLHDFDIPLHLGKTVTRTYGAQRLEAVETAAVDEHFNPIPGTEETLACDSLILSVGLIPENELAETLDVPLCPATKGPFADQHYQTLAEGIFSCGNALHVNDLVDYVSESGEAAGRAAARYTPAPRALVEIRPDGSLLYAAPQYLDLNALREETVLFFRSKDERGKTRLTLSAGDKIIHTGSYTRLRPPEMERIAVDFTKVTLAPGTPIHIRLTEA